MPFYKNKGVIYLNTDKLIFNKYYEITELSKYEPISVDLGLKDDILILYLHENTNGNPFLYKIVHLDNGEKRSYEVVANKELHFLQLIEDNYLLICGYLAHDQENNAFIYDKKGNLLKEFCVGNGVNTCKVDQDHHIWIGYSDEGIFHESEIGSKGIVCFDKNGAIIYDAFDMLVEQRNFPPIDHCHAVNISDSNDVWLYYYSADAKYPIVQLKKNSNTACWWESNVSRGENLVVGHNMVFVLTHEGDIVGINLENKQHKEYTAYDTQGNKLTFNYYFGRGSILYGVSKNIIYKLDLEKF